MKIAAVEEISKHSILDIELNKENLFPCVLMGFTTKQSVIKEGRYCKIQKISTRSKKLLLYLFKMTEVIHVCTKTESTKLMSLSIQVYDNEQIWTK